MPSYFYHISLELLSGNPDQRLNSYSQSHNDRSFEPHASSSGHSNHSPSDQHIIQTFRDAFQPFQQKKRLRAGKGVKGDSYSYSNGGVLRESRNSVVGGNSAGLREVDQDTNGIIQYRASSGTTTTPTAATVSITPLCGASQQAGPYPHQYRAQPLDDSAAISPFTSSSTAYSKLAYDKRLDQISIASIDMVVSERSSGQGQSQGEQQTEIPPQQVRKGNNGDSANGNQIAKGIGTSVIGGLATKGKYIPLDQKVSESAWGIVHLYRDVEESSALYKDDDDPSFLKGSALARSTMLDGNVGGIGNNNNKGNRKYGSADVVGDIEAAGPGSGSAGGAGSSHSVEDCTTLCILAVPSYMSPSDFLGFVGEQTRDEVSHFRMVRTARANRYMVLMKFRSGKRAKEWQRDWNGKVFNSMESETCHVVFVKTVEIQVEAPGTESKFPDMNNDPFTPSTVNHTRIPSNSSPAQSAVLSTSSLSTKPLAPPTPSLIELPTCPVCLERMDETTGLLTIICQHVFHCTCLQKWKGSGCPVCRYTQDEFGKRAASHFDCDQEPTECQVCHSEANLWLCLICGNVGCGRYDEAHAFAHFKETSHAFAMDLASQRVWDYVGDGYVHRIIQNKSDGKLVELPAAGESALDPPDWADAVPREKLENMSVEYTHLLTSQLESQRTYFEEVVERAADKASVASAAATAAQEAAEAAVKNLSTLQSQYDTLVKETIPNLEREKGRAERRAEKFETMAHRMEKEWREEKAMNGSLMGKIEFLNAEVQKLTVANEDLKEQNRDLSFFISGVERLKGQGEDVVEGTGPRSDGLLVPCFVGGALASIRWHRGRACLADAALCAALRPPSVHPLMSHNPTESDPLRLRRLNLEVEVGDWTIDLADVFDTIWQKVIINARSGPRWRPWV
ncbi:hypothetical protein PABG_03077 [Paracoccidioides brasiliensis Pb03]|nr:hypothetical protein PABG_03077 [Paracoccidioides brasiliensis Pb03]